MCGVPRRRYAPPFGFGSKTLGKPFLDDGELSAGCRGKSLPQGARQVWHWCGMRASAVKRWRGGGLHASAGFSSALAYVQPKVEHTSHGSHVLWQRGGFMGRGKNLNLTPNSRKAHRAAYDRDYRAAARLILTLEKRKARDSEMAELQLKALEALKDIDAKREETALGATAVFKDGLASAAVVLKSHFDSRSRTDLTDMKQAMSYMNLQEECAHKSSLPPSAQHVPAQQVPPSDAAAAAAASTTTDTTTTTGDTSTSTNKEAAAQSHPGREACATAFSPVLGGGSGTSSPHGPGPSTQLRLNVAREKGFGTTPRYCSDSTPMCQLTR